MALHSRGIRAIYRPIYDTPFIGVTKSSIIIAPTANKCLHTIHSTNTPSWSYARTRVCVAAVPSIQPTRSLSTSSTGKESKGAPLPLSSSHLWPINSEVELASATSDAADDTSTDRKHTASARGIVVHKSTDVDGTLLLKIQWMNGNASWYKENELRPTGNASSSDDDDTLSLSINNTSGGVAAKMSESQLRQFMRHVIVRSCQHPLVVAAIGNKHVAASIAANELRRETLAAGVHYRQRRPALSLIAVLDELAAGAHDGGIYVALLQSVVHDMATSGTFTNKNDRDSIPLFTSVITAISTVRGLDVVWLHSLLDAHRSIINATLVPPIITAMTRVSMGGKYLAHWMTIAREHRVILPSSLHLEILAALLRSRLALAYASHANSLVHADKHIRCCDAIINVNKSPDWLRRLLRECGGAGDERSASTLFTTLRTIAGSPPTADDWAALIEASARGGVHQFQGAIKHYNAMRAIRVTPNVAVYDALLVAARYARDPVVPKGAAAEAAAAAAAATSLDGLTSSSPQVVAASRYGQVPDGAIRAAILFNDMKTQGLKPRASTYALLIDVFASRHRHHWMSHVFTQYLERTNTKQILTVKTFNQLLASFVIQGQLALVDKVMSVMNHEQVAADVETYTYLLIALRNAERYAECLMVLPHMKSFGITPNVVIYNILLDVCANTNRVPVALALMDEMKAASIYPTAESYASIIDGYLRVGSIFEAVTTFRTMISNEIRPLLSTGQLLMRHVGNRSSSSSTPTTTERVPALPHNDINATTSTLVAPSPSSSPTNPPSPPSSSEPWLSSNTDRTMDDDELRRLEVVLAAIETQHKLLAKKR